MKRVPIPPTKYDPMRPVQAKMAAPVGGPGVGIPPTRFGAFPIQRNIAAPLSASSERASVSFPARHIQRAAAVVSFRTYGSDLVADSIGDMRLKECEKAPVYIGKDDLLAAKLRAGNIYCLAVYLKSVDGTIKSKADIPKLNKMWLRRVALKRVDVNVIGFDASQAYLKEDAKKVDEIRGTTEEVVFFLQSGYVAESANKLVYKGKAAGTAAAGTAPVIPSK